MKLVLVFAFGACFLLLKSFRSAREYGTTRLQIGGIIAFSIGALPVLWAARFIREHESDILTPRGLVAEQVFPTAFLGGLAICAIGVAMAYFGRKK